MTFHRVVIIIILVSTPIFSKEENELPVLRCRSIYDFLFNYAVLFSPRYFETEGGHPYRYLWLCQSFVGLIGTGLNSFVLSIFWTERQSLNTTINAMIWYSYHSYEDLDEKIKKKLSMNTLLRVLYTVAIQWRTYLMFCGPEGGWGCTSLFSREMVCLISFFLKETFNQFSRIVS